MPKRRTMPKGLQIHMFKKLFLKANAHREDPHAEMDNIDWEAVVDETLHYAENIHNLEENYPKYLWQTPEQIEKELFGKASGGLH